ncbi:MAG TPA: hypothetical protein VG125_28320 [Pirellulales bacterium]|jgi:hypothetical protein|nr:hypothetical protein [Pirellulales bacterium]
MPLRDHFRPPLDNLRHWEALHGGWPMMIVATLRDLLPKGYFAEPRIHLGSSAEARPTLSLSTDLPGQDVYEVKVFEEKRHSRLVAAIEIVSPANKDRPDSRRAFIGKCAGLLREHVSVTIVDLVTTRAANLYAELLDLVGHADSGLGTQPPSLYASACRMMRRDDGWLLETWAEPLVLDRALPTMPLWLADNLAVPLELERSYEESCGILGIA